MPGKPDRPATSSGPNDLSTTYERLVRERGGRGLLITLEGIDGCGKSTQHERLAARLLESGLPMVVSREPTDGPHGRRIRELLSRSDAPDQAMAQQLRDLFLADREEHVAGLIAPALESGKLVLLDRYYHSSIAYQGAAGLDPTDIKTLNEAIAPVPDLVIIFDLPVEEAGKRLSGRRVKAGADEQADGFEAKMEYQIKVRGQYLAMVQWDHVTVVDGALDINQLERMIFDILKDRLHP